MLQHTKKDTIWNKEDTGVAKLARKFYSSNLPILRIYESLLRRFGQQSTTAGETLIHSWSKCYEVPC